MALLTMRWHDLMFAHWPVDAAALRRLVPAPLELDLHDGVAWLGVVPFGNARVRPLGMPLPGEAIGFAEVNVRTYVRAPDGTPGVWFLSLDGGDRVGAVVARLTFGIDYHHAAVALAGGTSGTRATMRRGGTAPVSLDVSYRPVGGVIVPSALDTFLTDRLTMFGVRRGRLLRADVRHAPWRLHAAEAEWRRVEVTGGLGLPALEGDPLLRWAEPVDVSFPRLPTPVVHPR
jgi:uncharacterized protein YqjF (DUF2071 family)